MNNTTFFGIIFACYLLFFKKGLQVFIAFISFLGLSLINPLDLHLESQFLCARELKTKCVQCLSLSW